MIIRDPLGMMLELCPRSVLQGMGFSSYCVNAKSNLDSGLAWYAAGLKQSR